MFAILGGVPEYTDIRNGVLRECSIGFLPQRVRFERHHGRNLRRIQRLELIEISLVTLAANPSARLLTIDGVSLSRGPGPPHASPSSLARSQRRLQLAIPA